MLGTYPIGGPSNIPPVPDYAGMAGQAAGLGAAPSTGPLPNYAGQAQSAAAQGAFSPPPPSGKPSFFAPDGFLANFIQSYAAGLGNPAAQQFLQQQDERRRAQADAARQAMAPQHLGDNLVQLQPDGSYKTLWSPPSDDTPKPTEFQRNYQFIKDTFGPDAAGSFGENTYNPVRWVQADDPATGGKILVPYNHNGPLAMQGQAPAIPGQYPVPQPSHIAALRQRPDMAADFDKKFGPGASARYLTGGPGPSGPATFPQ